MKRNVENLKEARVPSENISSDSKSILNSLIQELEQTDKYHPFLTVHKVKLLLNRKLSRREIAIWRKFRNENFREREQQIEKEKAENLKQLLQTSELLISQKEEKDEYSLLFDANEVRLTNEKLILRLKSLEISADDSDGKKSNRLTHALAFLSMEELIELTEQIDSFTAGEKILLEWEILKIKDYLRAVKIEYRNNKGFFFLTDQEIFEEIEVCWEAGLSSNFPKFTGKLLKMKVNEIKEIDQLREFYQRIKLLEFPENLPERLKQELLKIIENKILKSDPEAFATDDENNQPKPIDSDHIISEADEQREAVKLQEVKRKIRITEMKSADDRQKSEERDKNKKNIPKIETNIEHLNPFSQLSNQKLEHPTRQKNSFLGQIIPASYIFNIDENQELEEDQEIGYTIDGQILYWINGSVIAKG